jgi:hypothetical protein
VTLEMNRATWWGQRESKEARQGWAYGTVHWPVISLVDKNPPWFYPYSLLIAQSSSLGHGAAYSIHSVIEIEGAPPPHEG